MWGGGITKLLYVIIIPYIGIKCVHFINPRLIVEQKMVRTYISLIVKSEITEYF